MIVQPKLTVCVPSRNRQRYFQETIRSLLVSMRTDVEYIFADNSDDPVPMQDFIQDIIGDPRVTFIPPADKVLSMVDNWERCMEKATGEFVCFIGDDDYVDVDVVDLINRTQAQESVVDVFVWSRLTYNWPLARPKPGNVRVPLGTSVHKIPRYDIYRTFFSWAQHSSSTPNCPFAIYHSAVSKRSMDKVKQKFGGRYFEHPVVDFENSCKLLVTAEHFFYSERSFSVMGACPESNSASIWTIEKIKESHQRFMTELGRNMDNDDYMKDFPFPSVLGLAACIAQCQHWFRTTYGYKEIEGWEKNFADACAHNCGMMHDREAYEIVVSGYEEAFRQWKGGKFMADFKPKYIERNPDVKIYFGIEGGSLYMDEAIAGARTPADIYSIVNQVLVPAQELKLEFINPNAVSRYA